MKTIRYSGRPVNLENLKAFEQEWKAEYDRITAEHAQDMLTVQAELAKLETALTQKYQAIENLTMPTSRKMMLKMIEEFQCPVMFAKSSQPPHEVVMVLMDMPLM